MDSDTLQKRLPLAQSHHTVDVDLRFTVWSCWKENRLMPLGIPVDSERIYFLNKKIVAWLEISWCNCLDSHTFWGSSSLAGKIQWIKTNKNFHMHLRKGL